MNDELKRLKQLSGQVGLFEDEAEIPGVELPIGKHNDMDDEEFDAEQLAMGVEVEMEHTDDPELAKAIAKDHLAETPDYYTRLADMMGGGHDDMDDMDDVEGDMEVDGEFDGAADMDDVGAADMDEL